MGCLYQAFPHSKVKNYIKQEEERLEEAYVVKNSKETVFSRHKRDDTHMNSQTLTVYVRRAQVKLDKTPAWTLRT